MVNQKYLDKAEVLIEALPYIQRFNRKIVVIKYGGSAMLDEELKTNVIKDAVLLKLVGFKPIIVHGGGKEISKWVGKVGMEAKFINGLRVTDAQTMEIAEMVLARVNKELVTYVESLGVQAVGISGKDGGLLKCKKKYSGGEDIGFVGDITEVNPKILYDLLEKDFLPIVFPIGFDDNYDSYNINADDAACAIAEAVHAEKLAFLSDIEGVSGKCHVDCCGHVKDWHNSNIYRHCNTSLTDCIQPIFELLHIPAKLSHDVVSTIVLFLSQNCDISIKAAACNVPLRGSSNCDLEFVTKLVTNEFNKVCSVVEITTGCCLTKRNISTKCKHMIYAFCKVLIQLLFDSLFGVLDYCEMSNRNGSCIFDHLTYFSVSTNVSAACTVCTGNVLWFVLHQMIDCSRKVLHSFFCLRREKLEGQKHFFSHSF